MTALAYPAIMIAQAHEILTAPGSEFEIATVCVGDRPVRIWRNAPTTMAELLAAGPSGDRAFLVHENERVSFDTFRKVVPRLAQALQAHGVRPGDRVAIAMRNLPEWVVAFFAITASGAIAVPLNAWWNTDELAYALGDSGVKLAICDEERLARMREAQGACPALETIVACRVESDAKGVLKFEDLVGRPDNWASSAPTDVSLAPVSAEDIAAIFYTSGTTGRPKGAVLSHRNVTTVVMAHAFSQARRFLRRGEAVPVPQPDAPQKVSLLSIPLFHVTGSLATMLSAWYRGTRLVLTRRFDERETLALIERERVTTIGGVPTIAWRVLDHPDRDRYDLSSLQVVSYGGAPAAPELVRRIDAELRPALGIATGWGMTETAATLTHHMGDDYAAHPASCGPPLPVADVRIVAADGSLAPTGSPGELQVRGPMVVRGYWNRPDADAATFAEGGWLRTGDIASVDGDGFVTIRDRLKDMIIRGGENIYCVEVEDALYAHPAIGDAAVVPVSHPTLGEEPAAVVALRPGEAVSEADLRAFLDEKLAPYKRPVRYVFLPELPRNAAGKVLKRDLRSQFDI